MSQIESNSTPVSNPAILAIPRLIILDLESTGLNKEFDRIIELGVIELQRGVETLEYSRTFSGGLTFASSRVHGIDDKERKEEKSFEACASDISIYLSNAVLAGHNVKRFDIPMIRAKLAVAGLGLTGISVIDTIALAKRLGIMGKSLKSLCGRYNITYGGHRGLSDARCTLSLLDVLAGELGATTPEDLIEKG